MYMYFDLYFIYCLILFSLSSVAQSSLITLWVATYSGNISVYSIKSAAVTRNGKSNIEIMPTGNYIHVPRNFQEFCKILKFSVTKITGRHFQQFMNT